MRFPPRSELPSRVTIKPLPLVGTTWYERGVRYWARRIGIGLMLALCAFVWPAAIEGALQDISPPGTGLYDGLAAGEVVFTIVTGVLIFRRAWRNALNGVTATRRDTRRASMAAASIGPLAFTTGGALAGLLVFSSLITSGLLLAVFVTWLAPMPPVEQYERRKIAEDLRVHYMLEQLSPRSKHYGSKNHHRRRR